jgi:hypothetical protein
MRSSAGNSGPAIRDNLARGIREPATNSDVTGKPIGARYYSAFGATSNGSALAPYNVHTFRGIATAGGVVESFAPTGDVVLRGNGAIGDKYCLAHNTRGLASARGGCRVEHRTLIIAGANGVVEWGVTNASGAAIFTTGARAGFRWVDGDLVVFFVQPALGIDLAIPRATGFGPFQWLDKLDGTGPSGQTIALAGTLYTVVQVGSTISFAVRGAANAMIEVIRLEPGGPLPSPVPNPPSVLGYASVEQTANGSPPVAAFGEIDAIVLESTAFSVVPVTMGQSPAVVVAAGTSRALAQYELNVNINAAPNPYNLLLDELEILSTQPGIYELWLVVAQEGPGGYTSGVPFANEMTFSTNPAYTEVQSSVPGLARRRYFAEGTTFTTSATAVPLAEGAVQANVPRQFVVASEFDRARTMAGTCGDGAVRSIVIVFRSTTNQAPTVQIVSARCIAIL